jgi:hypothetical protein
VFVATAIALDLVLAARHEHVPASALAWLSGRARSLAWLAPAGGLAVAWSLAARITLTGASLSEPQEIGTMRMSRALHALPLWTFDVFLSHVDELCGGVWWTALAVLAILGARAAGPRQSPHAETDARARPFVLRLLARLDPAYVPLLCVLAVFIVTPFRVGAGGMLNVRLAPLVALTAVLTVARSTGKLRAAVLCAAALATVVHAADATWEIRAIAAEHVAELDSILAAMRPGTRLVTLAFDPRRTHTHFDPYPFAGSYHRARGGRVASYSFSALAHWPVQFRSDARPPPKAFPLWIYAPCEYRHAIDGPYYDYVLVSGAIDPFADQPAGPAFRELRRVRGGFVLYEKIAGEWWTGDGAAGPCAP